MEVEVPFKVMLHGTIRNDDFLHNTALQCWNNVVTIPNNVATMLLLRCVALCCELPTLNLLVFMPFSMPSPSSYPNDDDDDF